MQIVAEQLFDKKTEGKLQNIDTIARRGFHTAKIFIGITFTNVPSYGLQLNEPTDVESRAQIFVYVKILDIDLLTFVDEYLCCPDLGENTTT